MQQEFIEDFFHLPLSQQAHQEFIQMKLLLMKQYLQHSLDIMMYGSVSGGVQKFLHKKLTRLWLALTQHHHISHGFGKVHVKLSTKSSCIFYCMIDWNLLVWKKFYLETYNRDTLECAQEETLIHLFWTCPSAQCWDFIYIPPEREATFCLRSIPWHEKQAQYSLCHRNHHSYFLRDMDD